jgi:hypothetical protein
MDHSTHTHLAETELNQATLEGANIYGPDDETVGSVSHVHGSGTMSQIIVDVGGFLGIGAKPVAIDSQKLSFMRDDRGKVLATTTMTMTKEDLKTLPEHHD